MIEADLHIHSEYGNDGELAVNKIVQKCIENQMDTLSITDHLLQRGMLMTGGRVFHGKNKPLIDIGNYAFNDKYHNII